MGKAVRSKAELRIGGFRDEIYIFVTITIGCFMGSTTARYWAPRRGSGFCPNEEMHAGERLLLQSAGGGGYGERGARDRAALARDVAEGYVSQDSARKDYGNT